MKVLALFLLLFIVTLGYADSVDPDCSFLREAKVEIPSNLKPVRIQDFLIYSNDPQAVAKNEKIIARSAYFLQTELGWKIPSTRQEMNRPVLDVYFVSGFPEFTGTVLPGPIVVLNENVLAARDFAALWIHFLAHASELMYRSAQKAFSVTDYWFYEATAGWMEGQFSKPSFRTRLAQHTRRFAPQVPLDDDSPDLARGASLMLDLVSRTYRDVIRQTWEQWSFASEERALETLRRVLQLNHLPSLDSYLLNYFLGTPSGTMPKNSITEIVVQPYSAAVIQDIRNGSAGGGMHLTFTPTGRASYSAALIHFAVGEKEGTIAIKPVLRESWSVGVPYTEMARFKLIIMNGSAETLRGTIATKFDFDFPADLEYFRANAGEDGGVQLEWKTASENGVAFWNLYRISNDAKERLNSFPIPASIDSQTGVHYVFVDSESGAAYFLEAITGEGIPSPVARTRLEK
ncbi:hypothetical protein L0156_07610 [bacterium]|nr:hypothetical protein [bacterium]